ncbi:MAG: DUF1732 domain-containing protein, partial [Kiritimatiellia bacterium]|nr:DUF1732 domain-containing protein [Kiritimatiellia bacterium]
NLRIGSGGNGTAVQVRIRKPVAKAYLDAFRQAGQELGLPDDLKLKDLAEWPDVMEVVRPEEDTVAVWPAVQTALQNALRQLVQMREAEGRVLSRDLKERIKRLRGHLDRIRARAPGAVVRYRKSLLTRLKEADLQMSASDDRVLKEIALFADRADISEEITRLRSHLDQFDSRMKAPGAAGRALDFLAQEILREINTLSAKSGDSTMLREGISFKAELESLREQIQNVE